MAEFAENRDTTLKIETITTDTGNDESFATTLNLPRLDTRNRGKSGDWKHNDDFSWYINSRNINGENVSFSPENLTEWKYKNLYSISDHNGGLPANWSCCRTAALATAALGSNFNEPKNETNISLLVKFRDYLANYQESYGIPRTEYSFPALIKVMGQATGRSLLALLYIVVNITPIAQILPHILRFILDKAINIQNTNDCRQVIVKYTILGLQLLCIYVCLVFIFGFIVTPILHMTVGILVKIMLYD